MDPLDKNRGCDPMSSNCVIWQGPDIECIDLCKGDSISEVVYKLATELCTLLETFNINNFDLSCFDLAECAPDDFTGLINLLIERICVLEGIDPSESSASPDCPDDCIVDICQDFYYQNPQGDTVKTMTLTNYVLAIGNRVCQLIGQIGTINNTLSDHEARISGLEDVQGQPGPPAPGLVPICVLPQIPVSIEIYIAALEQAFCNHQNHTGGNQAILIAIQAACQGLNQSDQLNGSGSMSDLPGWYASPSSLAESFSNLWKTVCDIRGAIQFIQNNCCDTGCDAINLIVDAVLNDPTEIQLTFSGSIPNNYVDAAIGSTIEITDVGGGGPQVINGVAIKSAHVDSAQPLILTLAGVNGAIDVVVKVTYRFFDPISQTVCENIIQVMALGTNSCPDITLIPSYTQVDYNFIWAGTTPTVVTMELWNDAETIMFQSTALNITGNNPSGEFLNLTEGVVYKIRIVINGIPCDFESFTTLEYPCTAPTLSAPTIDYTDSKGDQTGITQSGWQTEYDSFHP